MTEERKRGGTSVEQILSSIRRIISEEALPPSTRREAPSFPQAKEMDVLDLTEWVDESPQDQEKGTDQTQSSLKEEVLLEAGTKSVLESMPTRRGGSVLASFLGGAGSSEGYVFEQEEEFGPQAKMIEEKEAEEARTHTNVFPAQIQERVGEGEGLISNQAEAQVSAAFSSLCETVRDQEAQNMGASGQTVEDLVMEVLQPQVRAWLETHLPDLVERLVRQEIERLVPPKKS